VKKKCKNKSSCIGQKKNKHSKKSGTNISEKDEENHKNFFTIWIITITIL